MPFIVFPMTVAHWADVSRIYQDGINTGQATFAIAPPASWDEWRRGKINSCSLVARDEDNLEIAGWAALSPVSSRAVYAGVAEVSIYVDTQARGQGMGSVLLKELIHLSELNGIWTLQAGIFPENRASLQLHLKHGFRAVGLREKLGRMEFGEFKGKWRDVMLLERRSQVVGI
jgi:L-amino acid N-acyltransferase YncA